MLDLTVDGLDQLVRGRVVRSNDADYDEARSLYNGMIDKRPRAVAQCADVADVAAAVRWAATHDVPLAVRGGGHNGAGLAGVDDGLVVDLTNLRGIHVDPNRRTVRVGGGCTSGDVDHATHAFGLAVPFGHRVDHGCRRTHAGWRHRLPHSPARPDDRQPPRGGRRPRRRTDRHRVARGAPGPVLGDPWGRGQLRGRGRASCSGHITSIACTPVRPSGTSPTLRR